MSWKSIACIAALGAMAAPAMALPSITVVDNLNGTGSLNVVTTAAGSIAAELTLELTGATLTGATINSSIFDTANPGDSPFIPGTVNGGDANGLVLGLANNRLFASFGSGNRAVGTHKLLDFTYTGSGTAKGDGFVGSIGALTDVAAVTINIGALPPTFGDFEPDGDVDIIDFGLFADTYGKTTGQPGFNVKGDSEPDGDVDIIDFGLFADNYGTGTSSSVAVPEPTAALLGLIGVACLGFRRV